MERLFETQQPIGGSAIGRKVALRRRRRMTSHGPALCFAAVLGFLLPTSSNAAALRIEPVLVEVSGPGAASTLTLRNEDAIEVTVQLRVFKWSQKNGKETLEPTTDVVASPPIVSLSPKTNYIARIVRVTKQPLVDEETYRVLIDQLPSPRAAAGAQVNVLIRQSVPVFFNSREARQPALAWSLASDGTRLVVTAQNAGDRRLRISSLTLRDSGGLTVSFGNGLIGYVLGGSIMSWTAPAEARGFSPGAAIEINAVTDAGPIHAVVRTPPGR